MPKFLVTNLQLFWRKASWMYTYWGTNNCNMMSDVMFRGVAPIMWFSNIKKV